MLKNFLYVNYGIAALMILVVLVLLYGAMVVWKAKSKFISIIFVILAGMIGYFVYVLYGPMIMQLFGL